MKEWLSVTAQVQKHLDRGLDSASVSRRDFALFLYSNNYYRVSGYGRCFYDNSADRYVVGTTAQHLMDAYELDRRVRNLVLDGVGVVEPTLRSRVAYHVTQSIGGSDDYLAESFYVPAGSTPTEMDDRAYDRWHKEIANRTRVIDDFHAIQNRNEIFIQHHIKNGDPIPFWEAIEVISIGTFSRFLRALRDKKVLTPVAKSMNIEDEAKLLQAVQNIAFLRNIAAHHGRLWNRRFDGHVTLPQIALDVKRLYLHPKTPAAALTLLAGMVDQIEKSTNYSTSLLDLLHSDSSLIDGYYRPIL
ncbi:MAG: Abi family protein [Ancrocorticia sp.]|uniref:Abi family protein n=1 Tax=Ancrocorticia sp. TaxID=2593684 RepID=UPI003F8E0693